MGSDSDLPVMSEAAKILDELQIPYEINIVSAHRTPDWMYDYAKTSEKKGLKVLIAGAGGSAHLPGMTASLTHIPVIGVPMKTKTMNGVDSLYSIVQMPAGIPVATVAINGAKNAGILAAEILGTCNGEIGERVKEYKSKLSKTVLEKNKKLIEIGYEKYLKNLQSKP